MSLTETEIAYDDELLRLARDPNLNREKGKTSKLISIIQGFPLAERTVSRLCQLSLSILQTLEKIELNLRNWAFMSLDLNSSHHFDQTNPNEIKTFNNNVSMRVIDSCQELTMKLNKISADMDFITQASRSLTPMEFLSDSGTLLTSLSLRNIKLKDELREKITIAYSKAKLITIGTNLESMLRGGTAEQRSTVESYKQFVVSLLGQLNAAVDASDNEEKNECLAVINDMEQMFEVFKLQYAQGFDEEQEQEEQQTLQIEQEQNNEHEQKHYQELGEVSKPQIGSFSSLSAQSKHADFSDPEDLAETASTIHSTSQAYSHPMVHSITKSLSSPSDVGSIVEQHARRGSFSSVASTSILQKSTLSEELPYLMSAFNSAKTLEEDVFHYKDESEQETGTEEAKRSERAERVERSANTNSGARKADPNMSIHETKPQKQFQPSKHNLPQSSLYSSSQILPTPPAVSASSYLYQNSSLLSRLGIKPQVISATLPKHLHESDGFNSIAKPQQLKVASSLIDGGPGRKGLLENKENEDQRDVNDAVVPLTRANLDTHNLSAFASSTAD